MNDADKLLPIPCELEQELFWAQSRPTSQMHGCDQLLVSDEQPFKRALNFSEERYRASYERLHPGQAWQLNQNPDAGFGAASTNRFLPTLIGNIHMLFTEEVSPARWLMGSEALATQGFPVVPRLWGIAIEDFPVLCSFNKARAGRVSRQLLKQAGNSMNVFAMTVLTLHGLSEWQRKQLPPLLANIRLSRSVARATTRARNFEDPMPPQKRLRAKGKPDE